MRLCSICKEQKDISLFYPERSRADGLSHRCKPCDVTRAMKWNAANRAKKNAANKRHYQKHRERYCAYLKEWRRKAGPEYHRARYPKIKDYLRAFNAKRKAGLRKACPAWANQFFISEAYSLATLRTKMTGYEWHVDHIVPLRSPIVCGLHVEHNLRVIPGVVNMQKSNKHWPDMPGSR